MRKVALIFPGQGSQYVGMGKSLYENYAVARETFEEANDELAFDLKALCFEGPIEKLTQTSFTQPAILTHSVAAYRVYMNEIGIEPALGAGHSLGEFSALACAEAIAFADAVKLVHVRGMFMQEAVSLGNGAMAAIHEAKSADIEAACREIDPLGQDVVISNYNSENQIVISGAREQVLRVSDQLAKRGAVVIPLKVSAPFHSPLMRSAAIKLQEELKNYRFQSAKWDIISNVTALPYRNAEEMAAKLVAQMESPVQWTNTQKYLAAHSIEAAVELGPQSVLTNLLKRMNTGVQAFSYDKDPGLANLRTTSAPESKEYDHKQAYYFMSRCLAAAVSTKNSNWDQEEYRKGVIEPYRKVQELFNKLEADNQLPTIDHLNEALDMVHLVFRTKRASEQYQAQRMERLLGETGMKGVLIHNKERQPC